MKHIILGLALCLVVIVSGCSKKEEAPVPAAPDAVTTNAPAAP
jgi:type IV pilus biogenesis protein CpaD/CtpE